MRRYLLLITLIVLFCACQKNEMADEANVQKGITCEVPGFVLSNQTKTTLTLSEGKLSFSWNNNDSVAVFGSTGHNQQLAMSISEIPVGTSAKQTANFTISEDFMLKKGNTYFAYTPVKNKSIYLDANAVPFDYSGQVQMTNRADDTDNLGSYDYMVSAATTASDNNVAAFKFSHLCCPIRIAVMFAPPGTYQGISIICSKPVFAVKGNIDLTTGAYSADELVSSLTINYNEPVTISEKSTLYAWMMVAPVDDFTDATFKVNLVLKGGAIREYEVNTKLTKFEKGMAYAIQANEDGGTLEPGPAIVDLGLPSGTIWAATNVGAADVGDIGSYFSWGEIETKNSYSTSNYSFGSTTAPNKYYNDLKYALEAEDDVAVQTYGTDWRMPYSWELNELFANCTWTKDEATNCYIGKSKINDNIICIPISGHLESSSLKTSYPIYLWAKNKNDIKDSGAGNAGCIFGTPSENLTATYAQRYYGVCVRAVRTVKNAPEYVDLGLKSGVKWGKYNIGAVSESDQKAPYFAWGELVRKADNYTPKFYKWYERTCTVDQTESSSNTTSYNFTRYNGSDNYKTMLPEDDPATVYYGKGWRTPTKKDWEDLFTECTWTKETNGNWRVTSKNGNYIILPKSYYRGGNSQQATANFYWSSSISENNVKQAYRFMIATTTREDQLKQTSYYPIATAYRTNGYTIRPVYVGTSNE